MKDIFKSNKVVVFAIVSMFILTIGSVTMAYFTPLITEGNIFSTTGTVDTNAPDITFTEISGAIDLSGTYPMTDEVGMQTTPYSFSITNNETEDKVKYQVILETKSGNTLDNTLVSTSLGGVLSENESVTPMTSGYTNAYVIYEGKLAKSGSGNNSVTHDLRIWINEAGNLDNAQNKTWYGKIVIKASVAEPTIIDNIIASSKGVAPTSLFESVATTDEGVYEMEDDYGTSYYFRGNVTNNYVSFAGYCWRIIRINGDESLRLIYDGTSCHVNGESSADRILSTKSKFNSNLDDHAYVGYMHGLTGITTDVNRCLMLDASNNVVDNIGVYTDKSSCESAGGKWTTTAYEATHANVKDSTIKDYLDEWYKTNIVDKGYDKNVADTLFCGDRSMGTSNNLGYGTNYTEFSAYNRVYNEYNPTLKCPQKQDAYTVSDETYGNGDLEYPVGLMGTDEIILAGSTTELDNKDYFLYKGATYWLLSPSLFGNANAGVFVANINGNVSFGVVYYPLGVAPVINLTKEYASKLSGDGSKDVPYAVIN